MQRIAVIGGGITGVTTAYALLKRGLDVTLYERHRYAAMEASCAGGGQLAASNAEVWTHWSTLLKGVRWMLRPAAPLRINPRPTWHKLSWFAEFISAIPRYADNTTETARLAIAARDCLYRWARQEGIAFDLERRGALHVYRDRASFERAAGVSQLLAKGGLERRPVTPEELRAIEPQLAGDYHGGFFTESDATGDIHKYTQGLAAAVERRGGTICYGQAVSAVGADGSGAWVCVQGERETYDGLVVCAGVASRGLAASLGDRLNLYPVKGYSITVHLDDAASREAAPRVSVLDDEAGLAASRLGAERFRVAGTVEFNGLDRDIRHDRIRSLVAWTEQSFPGIATRRVEPWAGLRPMLPDMMPRVGRGRLPRVFYNTGHGHLGWTLSAITAELVADSVMVARAQQAAPGLAR